MSISRELVETPVPHTIQLRPAILDELITLPRIGSYQAVFQPKSDVELAGSYLWNSHVVGALYPLISAVEVSLRNAIDQALTVHHGRFWWSAPTLQYQPPAPPAQDMLALIRRNFGKASRMFVAEMRSRHGVIGHVTPDHHRIVAKTEFSTWEYVLAPGFMGNGKIWPSRLGLVLRGQWPHARAANTLSYARDLVKTVREFRNRLSHHEPAWKRSGVATEADAMAHLNEKLASIESLLALLYPEKLRMLKQNGLVGTARRACTLGELRRFQRMATTHKVGSMRKLRSLVAQCKAEDVVISAKVYGGGGKFFYLMPV